MEAVYTHDDPECLNAKGCSDIWTVESKQHEG